MIGYTCDSCGERIVGGPDNLVQVTLWRACISTGGMEPISFHLHKECAAPLERVLPVRGWGPPTDDGRTCTHPGMQEERER